jgi:hypothetical protein
MTGVQPTPTPPARQSGWGQVAAWDPLELAELARVLRVISDFFTARPTARDALARFAFAGVHPVEGSRGACFWTEELLDYLDQAVTELTDLAAAKPGGSW